MYNTQHNIATKATLIIGFGALLLVALMSLLAVNYLVNSVLRTHSETVEVYTLKKDVSSKMWSSAQQRLLLVSQIFIGNAVLETNANALKMSPSEVGNRFKDYSKRLGNMPQTDKENTLLVKFSSEVLQLEKSVDRIVNLLIQGRSNLAFQEFNNVDFILQKDVGRLLEEFVGLQDQYIANNISETYSQVNRYYYWQFCIFLFLAGGAMILVIYVVGRLSSVENQLLKERNYAINSFDRISDCVISINEHKRIDYINSAGECLLNCVSKEVVGKRLVDILCPYNEKNERILVDIILDENDFSDNNYSKKQDLILHDVNDENIFVELELVKVFGGWQKNVLGYVVILKDMTKGKQAVMAVERHANTDNLTGLANRYNFEYRLKELLTISQHGRFHVVCVMELDRFSIVNDTCGDLASDDLLKKVGNLLVHNTRRTDVLARLEGDKFALILVDCDIGEAQTVAHNLIEAISTFRFSWRGEIFTLGVSIGLAVIDQMTGANVEMLLKAADAACHRAKDRGCNTCCVYNKDEPAQIEQMFVGLVSEHVPGDILVKQSA